MSEFGPATRANVAALIPAYLEQKHIADVVCRVREQLDHVLVVNDGSHDDTAGEATRGGAELFNQPQNRGKGAAIKMGLTMLQPRPAIDYVLLLDGDGQHLPEEIPRFLEECQRAPTALLLGNRMHDLHAMPFVRKLTNRYMSWQISLVCRQPIPDSQCGFRMVRRDLLAPLIAAPSARYDFETEMLAIAARLGHRIGNVPVSTVYGEETSKIHPLRDTLRFYRLLWRLYRSSRSR